MLRLIFFLSVFSVGFAGQITSIFEQIICDTSNSAWTAWFNTRDPLVNNGNDIEDFAIIRQFYEEASRCDSVLNVDYAVVQSSNNEAGLYQTYINSQGLFCVGSETVRCPNYKVRFCCPLLTLPATSNQCGHTNQQPYLHSSARIVNGFEARPHSFPWAISLQYKGLHDCGGVILDQWNILTAAHCLDYPNDLGNYLVRVGAHNRLTSGQTKRIARLILHPEYDEYRSVNDIGIIRLAEPIEFNDHIQPICLLDSIIEPELNANVYVVGWGNTAHQIPTSSSPVLLQARLRVISDCSMYFAYDSQKQICTAPNGPANKDHGSCQGDSGGGLFYNKNGRWYAAGVVSYAIGCGRQAFPTVFTKTSAYINWIRTTVNFPVST